MPHNRFEWIDRLKFVERDENKGTAFVFGLIARAEDSDSAPTVKKTTPGPLPVPGAMETRLTR